MPPKLRENGPLKDAYFLGDVMGCLSAGCLVVLPEPDDCLEALPDPDDCLAALPDPDDCAALSSDLLFG